MIKARFVEEQPEIKIITLEGKHYIYICRNGERKQEIYQNDGGDEIVDYWEYDYCEGVEDAYSVTVAEIRKDIEMYIEKWSKAQEE